MNCHLCRPFSVIVGHKDSQLHTWTASRGRQAKYVTSQPLGSVYWRTTVLVHYGMQCIPTYIVIGICANMFDSQGLPHGCAGAGLLIGHALCGNWQHTNSPAFLRGRLAFYLERLPLHPFDWCWNTIIANWVIFIQYDAKLLHTITVVFTSPLYKVLIILVFWNAKYW